MTPRYFLSLLVALLATTALSAQGLSGGFKVGANFSQFSGPSEQDASGMDLEAHKLLAGFHVGGIVNIGITDIFGVRGELLYSQKGTNHTFEGPSYWAFVEQPNNAPDAYHVGGTRVQRMIVVNSYIDIPFSAYIKLGKLELSGGANVAFLVGSRAAGEVDYSSTNVDPFQVSLDYNYFRSNNLVDPDVTFTSVRVGGQNLSVPNRLEAFNEAFGQTKRPYNVIDIGLNAGASFYLNKGLFIGLRATYGLLDVTREAQDVSIGQLGENNTFINRDDFDRNINLQVSLGFSF